MLMFERGNGEGALVVIGSTINVIAELSILVAAVQKNVGDKFNVYDAICLPHSKALSMDYVERNMVQEGVENNAMRNASAEIQE